MERSAFGLAEEGSSRILIQFIRPLGVNYNSMLLKLAAVFGKL